MGLRPFRNATSFSKATHARKGDHGVFETRRVGALAFPVGKQPRVGDSRPVAVFGNTKFLRCSQLRTIRKRPEATCPGRLQKHARGIDALVCEVPTHRGCVAEVGRRRCARRFSGSGGGTSVVLAQKRETAPGDVTLDVGSRWQNREIGVDRKRSPQKGDRLPVVALHGNLRKEMFGTHLDSSAPP